MNSDLRIQRGSVNSFFLERRRFNLRRQEEWESVVPFINDLYELTEHCGYTELDDEMIQDILIVGIHKRLSQKLQLDIDPTLEKTVTSVRQHEKVHQQQSLLHNEDMKQIPTDALQTFKQPSGRIYCSFESAASSDSQHSQKVQGVTGVLTTASKHTLWKEWSAGDVERKDNLNEPVEQQKYPLSPSLVNKTKEVCSSKSWQAIIYGAMHNSSSTKWSTNTFCTNTGAKLLVIPGRVYTRFGSPILKP